VAVDVTDAPTDQQQFSRQHPKVEANIPANADRAYVADAGYNCLEQLEYAEEQQVDVVLADPRPEHRSGREAKPGKRYPRSMFEYDKLQDHYRCPAGQLVTYWHTEKSRGRFKRVYRCKSCQGCSQQKQCLGEEKRKTIQRTLRRDTMEHLAEAMSDKSQTGLGRRRLAVRKQTVEPIIGNLKANLGFRRFNLSGLAAVRGEFTLMCIAHNLNRLIALIRDKSGSDPRTDWSWRRIGEVLGSFWAIILGKWTIPRRAAA
jgi:hypothetical protein